MSILVFSLVIFRVETLGADYAKQQTCLDCHNELSPKAVAAWRQSKHAAHSVGCADCHGKIHSTIFNSLGQVSAAVCGGCHAKQRAEFDQSLHAAAVDLMLPDPKFSRLSPALREIGCLGCHQVGNHSSDGSRGKCSSCHSSHAFSVEEARRPEACAECHSGPDHPQMAAWQASKHGQLFATPETRDQSPTCVTCHMPHGTHNTGVGLSFGQVGNGAARDSSAPPVKMRTISETDAKQKRQAMVQTCLPCHSSRFATDSLAKADAVKFEADAVLGEALKIITKLREEGLLGQAEPGNAVEVGAGVPAHALVLGPDQLYEGGSPIEQRFFDMFKFHHATTFKGAYHHSPEYTHNEGYLRLKQDLTYIMNEAARLRAESHPSAVNQK